MRVSEVYWFFLAFGLTSVSYHVAAYYPAKKKLILQPTPLFTVAREVKALKSFRSSAPSASERIAARNALGEAFGTKKAKANIRAYERNKVDVGALENVAGALQDRIDLGTENLPSQGTCRHNCIQSHRHLRSRRGSSRAGGCFPSYPTI